MRKPDFCLCENKSADQLCSYSAPLFSDIIIPPLLIPKILKFYLSSVSAKASSDPEDHFSHMVAHSVILIITTTYMKSHHVKTCHWFQTRSNSNQDVSFKRLARVSKCRINISYV